MKQWLTEKSIQVALTTRISVVFGIIGKYDSKDKNIPVPDFFDSALKYESLALLLHIRFISILDGEIFKQINSFNALVSLARLLIVSRILSVALVVMIFNCDFCVKNGFTSCKFESFLISEIDCRTDLMTS